MQDIYSQCLEIGRSNTMNVNQTQISQFLKMNNHFRQWEKSTQNFDLYTRNFSQFLRFETFPAGKIVYNTAPSKQFYIISGRALIITPKNDQNTVEQVLFNSYIEKVSKKIKKGIDESELEMKEEYKRIIIKEGEGFGDIQFSKCAVIAVDQLNVFTSMTNHYQKQFHVILSRPNFITHSLTAVLPFIDKSFITQELVPLFIEHSFSQYQNIFQRDQEIQYFYLLRQGACELYYSSQQGEEEKEQEKDGDKQDLGKLNKIKIKQGDFFGHEDLTGQTSNRIFSCISITPNTVIYLIERDALMKNKNQKVKRLILNNSFSKYHFYMQNFKSKGQQIRSEKNLVVKQQPAPSQSPYFPVLSSPTISSSQIFNKNEKESNEEKNIQTTDQLSSRSQNKSTKEGQFILNSPKNIQMINNYNVRGNNSASIKKNINSINKNNSDLMQKDQQLRASLQVPISPLLPLKIQLKDTLNSPISNFEKKENKIIFKQNNISAPISKSNIEIDSKINDTIEITPEKKKISQISEQKGTINLQANIDYIKSLRVNKQPYKVKSSSILEYFSQEPIYSLTHMEDETADTHDKTGNYSQNTQNASALLSPQINNKQNNLDIEQNSMNAINRRITRSFKPLHENKEINNSSDMNTSIDEDLEERKTFRGNNLAPFKKTTISNKNLQLQSTQNQSTKQSLQKVKNYLTRNMKSFASSLDKKVRFQGLEEINIENFNNYDDVQLSKKHSSLTTLSEIQSPVKSILRKKDDLLNLHPDLAVSKSASSIKFNSRAFKQLEGITQQKVFTIKKKTQSQKNMILASINSKI